MTLEVTPVILTFDEAPNIARVLQRVQWAKTVLVVDSGSTDGTQQIARGFANVRVCERAFDNFENQWNFAIDTAREYSSWLLALDADYVLSDEIAAAIQALPEAPVVSAYQASFVWLVHGRALRGSLYPAKPVLFDAQRARYVQRGHTQVLQVHGSQAMLPGVIFHDDRKSMTRWLRSQWRYAQDEAAMIHASAWGDLSCSARVRALLLPAAPLALLIALFVRGGILDGWPGVFYAMQRAVAELLIAMALVQGRVVGNDGDGP